MSKKKCGHIGRIERRVKDGPLRCHRQKAEVQVAVLKDQNVCLHATCPFARRPIPRVER